MPCRGENLEVIGSSKKKLDGICIGVINDVCDVASALDFDSFVHFFA